MLLAVPVTLSEIDPLMVRSEALGEIRPGHDVRTFSRRCVAFYPLSNYSLTFDEALLIKIIACYLSDAFVRSIYPKSLHRA